MLCQLCKENQANVQLNLILNGQRKDLKLCHDCYINKKNTMKTGLGPKMSAFPGFPFEDLFFNVQNNEQ